MLRSCFLYFLQQTHQRLLIRHQVTQSASTFRNELQSNQNFKYRIHCFSNVTRNQNDAEAFNAAEQKPVTSTKD